MTYKILRDAIRERYPHLDEPIFVLSDIKTCVHLEDGWISFKWREYKENPEMITQEILNEFDEILQ